MDSRFNSQNIPYSSTGKFSKIVLDYLSEKDELQPFYEHKPSLDGIKQAIANRQLFNTNRKLLADGLVAQYKDIQDADAVKQNIELLRKDNTFTICTAHQPNLFTGHLYFIYKIIHVIKLADFLSKEIPENHFVPVFFMGSEDADLEELNHIYTEGKKYTWNTRQTGAVGRMTVDKDLIKLIQELEGRLLSEPFGKEITAMLKSSYQEGTSIENATFLFVHELFKNFGLMVFLPDNPVYKREMLSVFESDLFDHTPAQIVNETSEKLAQHHHAQAFARDINLFYMQGNIRNRIVRTENRFVVHETDLSFSDEEMKKELADHPERFSPNVILRGLFQEKILPDIIFVGGGGELAYWLQLKDLFNHFKVPYPVLMLRNSFLIIEDKWNQLINKLGIDQKDLFEDQEKLFQSIVKKNSPHSLSLEAEIKQTDSLYDALAKRASAIDETLVDHIMALKKKQEKKLTAVEKKFVSAEKKKNEATQRQLKKLYDNLVPGGGLQERKDNVMLFYAKWGPDLLDCIYKDSPLLNPAFTIMTETGNQKS